MKSFEILLNSTPDLTCRNLWLRSEKVSLFIADRVSFSLVYSRLFEFCVNLSENKLTKLISVWTIRVVQCLP